MYCQKIVRIALLSSCEKNLIPKNGLTLYLDAASSTSYSGSGNTWSDLSGNNNHLTLYGNPTFDSNTNGGVINFDETFFISLSKKSGMEGLMRWIEKQAYKSTVVSPFGILMG